MICMFGQAENYLGLPLQLEKQYKKLLSLHVPLSIMREQFQQDGIFSDHQFC